MYCIVGKEKEPEGEEKKPEGEEKESECEPGLPVATPPPLPQPDEEEREREYQLMLDSLYNTLSRALERGERRRRRR